MLMPAISPHVRQEALVAMFAPVLRHPDLLDIRNYTVTITKWLH
jgi:hypothetical protein